MNEVEVGAVDGGHPRSIYILGGVDGLCIFTALWSIELIFIQSGLKKEGSKGIYGARYRHHWSTFNCSFFALNLFHNHKQKKERGAQKEGT